MFSAKKEQSRHAEFAEKQLAPSVLNAPDIRLSYLSKIVKVRDGDIIKAK